MSLCIGRHRWCLVYFWLVVSLPRTIIIIQNHYIPIFIDIYRWVHFNLCSTLPPFIIGTRIVSRNQPGGELISHVLYVLPCPLISTDISVIIIHHEIIMIWFIWTHLFPWHVLNLPCPSLPSDSLTNLPTNFRASVSCSLSSHVGRSSWAVDISKVSDEEICDIILSSSVWC